ncbi:MAG: Bug family tripartite tricarboxylate transporter substrate binding protein [Candidatus Binatia bacterium]
MKGRVILSSLTILAILLWGLVDTAISQGTPFFKGKTIRVICGYPPGGGYDTYSRVLARHMAKYIPGNPNIIVQNMPGAGSLVAANYIYRVAKPNGLTFGTFGRSIPLLPILGDAAAKFDPQKFTWLGTSSSYKNDAYVLILRPDLPIRTVEDLRKPGNVAHIGSSRAGSSAHDIPLILKETLKLNLNIISGYKGTADLNLAIERKEIDGRSLGLSAISVSKKEWLDDKKMRKFLQFARITRHQDLPHVPTARELAKDPKNRALIEFAEMPFFFARPFAAPPGIPADRTRILKEAFMKTHSDPQYLKQVKRLDIDVSPKSGDEIQKLLKEIAKSPPELIQRYKKILGIK